MTNTVRNDPCVRNEVVNFEQLGPDCCTSLIEVFAVHTKKGSILSYPDCSLEEFDRAKWRNVGFVMVWYITQSPGQRAALLL